jgi:hypothetical protein
VTNALRQDNNLSNSSNGFEIESILPSDIPEILDLKWSVFCSHYSSRDESDSYTLASVDWSKSIKVLHEARIVGIYLLKEEAIADGIRSESITTLHESLERYRELRGLHGVTLCLHEAYRGRGWGNLLKEYPGTLGYDYFWGVMFKTLGNLHDWEKRSRLVGESRDLYLILEDFRQT